MPLYELVAIASHYDRYKPLRDLVRSTAMHIMEHGGHVRSIKSWGTLPLPDKMRRHKVTHSYGDYYVMQFDCSPVTLKALDVAYGADPRVVRWTNIKIGEKLKALSEPLRGTQGWGSNILEPRYPHPSLLNDEVPRSPIQQAFNRRSLGAPPAADMQGDMFDSTSRALSGPAADAPRRAGAPPPGALRGGLSGLGLGQKAP